MQREDLKRLLTNLKEKEVRLIAVSKTKTQEEILKIYHLGHKLFGENKVQELVPKYEQLPRDIEWHMIGHLQKNKVKYIIPFVSMIHAVDSWDLLKEINKRAASSNRVIDFLFQVHIAKEKTKFGLDEKELFHILENPDSLQLNNVRACGLMGMATLTEDEKIVRDEFRFLKNIFDSIKGKYFPNAEHFKELSMGMSCDYEIAIEEGSTMVRLGTMIFGERSSHKT